MGLLIDVILEFVGSAISPTSERGMVGTLTGASIACASLALWLVLSNPSHWNLRGAYVGSLAIGGAGLLTSLLHLSRNESDRTFAVPCLTANAIAVAIGAFGVILT